MPQDDENKAVILLCSLPDSWDGVVTTINTSVIGKNKLVYDEVASTLLSEDMRRTNKESSSCDALTMVSTKNRGRTQQRGRNNNNNRRSQSARRSQSRGRQNGCWFCGKAGHVRKDCIKYNRAQEKVLDSGENIIYDPSDGVLVLQQVTQLRVHG